MKEHHPISHPVESVALAAATLGALFFLTWGQVYYGKGGPSSLDNQFTAPSTPASNPPSGFWENLEASVTPPPASVLNREVNDLLKEKPTLADLDQWKETKGENGEAIFTAQTKDGFWAKIVAQQEQKAWSAESYADDLLENLKEVDSGARLLTSSMATEEITIQKGEYLIIARARSPGSVGLDSLMYLLVISTGQFDEEAILYTLTMQAPHDARGRDYEDQATEALQKLSSNNG